MLDLKKLDACQHCPRLRSYLQKNRIRYPSYWNKPVPPSGDPSSPILIVGLAPGLHGANQTGVPFTGDASGELMFKVLKQLGIERQVRITNAVKCLPPENAPKGSEIRNCQKFLREELDHKVLIALGLVAHRAIITALGGKQKDYPFGHEHHHELPTGQHLVDSYHCSRYNIQTGRLTEAQFRSALQYAARLATVIPDGV